MSANDPKRTFFVVVNRHPRKDRPNIVKHRTDCEQFLAHLYFGGQRGVRAMPDENNEVKQVQEPAQEQEQQQPIEQKPEEPSPPEVQVAEAQAPEAAGAPSENPNP